MTDQSKKVKVALCQIFLLDGDRKGNLVRIENAIVEAKNGGAEIACFPETSILGWVNSDAHTRAHPVPGPDSDYLCLLAKKYQLYLAIGLAEKQDSNLYDSVILIDDNGNLILKHRKINILKNLMTPSYTAGSEIKVANTKFGRIGLLICADTFVETNLNKMKKLKPVLLLVPYGWAAKEEEWPEHGKKLLDVVKKTAEILGCPVIGTDLVGEISKGPWAGRTYGGQSVAVDKEGNIVYIAKDRDRDVRVVTIALN